MTTKAEVTEFINDQWQKGTDNANVKYWNEPFTKEHTATRIGLIQNWVSPEIATIIVKLVGPVYMIEEIRQNVSNSKK
tara:strand:+ start:980 stop:1213 length:234 start_codon:yes stop_codon:yes gene_type:complete